MDILSRWEIQYLLQYARPEKPLDEILSRWEKPYLLQYAKPEKPLNGYSQQMLETILTPIC
jgi:hypothetical protein